MATTAIKLQVPIELLDVALASKTTATTWTQTKTNLDTGDYDGNPVYEFEIVASNFSTNSSYQVFLLNSSGTTIATITLDSFNTTPNSKRYRVSFTPTTGASFYQVRTGASTSTDDFEVYAARIIITQDQTTTKTRIQIPLANHAANLPASAVTSTIDTFTSSTFGQTTQDNYTIMLLELSKLATIATTNPYSLEVSWKMSDVFSQIKAALFDTSNGNEVLNSEATLSSTSTQTTTVVNWSSDTNWITAHQYELRYKRVSGTATGNIDKACLYIRLTSLTAVQAYWRNVKRIQSTASFDAPYQRALYDASKYQNPTLIWDATLRAATPGTNNLEMIDSLTQDTGTGNAISVARINNPGSTKTRTRVTGISITSGDRYYQKVNVTTGEIDVANGILIVNSTATFTDNSTVALKTVLETASKSSTIACKTVLEKTILAPIALTTTLEEVARSLFTQFNLPTSVSQDASGDFSWGTLVGIEQIGPPIMTGALAFSFFATFNLVSGTVFNFQIPSTAIIKGIIVRINRTASQHDDIDIRYIVDNTVQLIKGGIPQGNNKADIVTEWDSTQYLTITYGSSSDLWGLSLTPADINAGNFGIAFTVSGEDDVATTSANIDWIGITVHYTVPNTLALLTTVSKPNQSTLALRTTLETGRNLGTAIYFSGGGYIDVPYDASFHPTDVLTVAITGFSTSWASITTKANLAGYAFSNSGFVFDCNDSSADGRLWFKLHRGGSYILLGIQLSVLTSGKHRFVGTFDGRFTKLYVDGVLQATDDFGSQTTIDQPTTNDLAIGDNMNSGSTPEGNPWNNPIDEFLLVHAAWNQTDINNDYGNANGQPLNRRTPANIPNLIVGMHFDDNTANDFSGNNHTGTVIGTATYNLGWHILTPPIALRTMLEKVGVKSTVALKTTLQSAVKKSTIALFTNTQPVAQQATIALFTNIGYRGNTTLALSTTLERVNKVHYPRGIAMSGLEFSTNIFPGQLNTDYFESAQTTYNYFANKGFPTVRFPILWERIQPSLNGALDPTYKSYVDASIQEATNAGQSVILDVHNFGRRSVVNPGGFSLLTSGTSDPMFQGSYSLASGVLSVNQFNRVYAGAYNNPVAPATTYAVQTDFQITGDEGLSWNALWIEFFRVDDNNRYYLVLSHQQNNIQLFQVVNGTQTQLGSTVSQVINNGTWYTVNIDVAQTTPSTITVSFNGTQILSVSPSPVLTHGFVSLWGNGVNASVRNFTLNVNGDTTSGRTGSGNFRVGDSGLPISAFADLWTKLATAYKNNPQVYGYDLMNEPHDMPVPTTTGNYNTTATTTLMMQAGINAVRAVDKHKWIFAEIDQWAGAQAFVGQYGSNPTPWWTDPSHKTVYVVHYYMDDDHSGTYVLPFKTSNLTAISGDVTPFFSWTQNHGLWGMLGEFGVPNTSVWQVCLTTLLDLTNTYNIWTLHWAAGDNYTAITGINPTTFGPPIQDAYQMAAVGRTTYLGMNLDMGTIPLGTTFTAAPLSGTVALLTTLEATTHAYIEYYSYAYFGDPYFGSSYFAGGLLMQRTDAVALTTTLEAVVPIYANTDQQNTTDGTQASFGQFTGVRYRGFGFTPNATGYIRQIAFQRNKGTQDIKIYIDNANTDSTPVHSLGNELQSFTVANANITGNYQIFTLSTPQYVIGGQQYCIYIAPWSIANNQYQNDVQSMFFASGTYAGGQEITNTNGTWSNESLTPVYTLWIQQAATIALVTTFEKITHTTVALFTFFVHQTQSTVAIKNTLEANKRSTIAIKTVLETKGIKSTLAIATKTEKSLQNSTVALRTALESLLQNSTIALSTKFETTAQSSTIALNTSFESAKTTSSLACKTILETTGVKSTIALKTILATASQLATLALSTTISKPVISTVALLTRFEKIQPRTLALFTSFQSIVGVPISILTILEKIQVKSTLALKTVLEVIPRFSTVAFKTTLESANRFISLALRTTLESAKQSTSVALSTTLESNKQFSSVAMKTQLEKSPLSTAIAVKTVLESAVKSTTIALRTTVETTKLFSTIALKTTFEKFAQFSTFASIVTLESSKKFSSLALKTTVESARQSTALALKTTLESKVSISIIAIKTTLEANKRSAISLLALFFQSGVKPVAISTQLDPALRFSTIALFTDLNHLSVSHPIALNTSLNRAGKKTLALTTTVLHFIGWHNDDFGHLGWEGLAADEDPAPIHGIAQDGHPFPPTGGFVDDGSQW